MSNYTKEELEEAGVVLTSLVSKSEKAKTNLIKGQLTLVENRIHALTIALSLLTKEIEK